MMFRPQSSKLPLDTGEGVRAKLPAGLIVAVQERLAMAGYKIENEFSTLDSMKWGFYLVGGQRVGISVGARENLGAIFIVVSGPDAQPIRRLLRKFERDPLRKRAVTRRGRLVRGSDLLIDHDVQQQPGYCYHGTSRTRLRSIAGRGLRPYPPELGPWDDPDKADWLPWEQDLAYEPRVFASLKFDVAVDYAEACRHGVVLRMSLNLGWESNGCYRYLCDPIDPDDIEVLWTDSVWHPLSVVVRSLPTRRCTETIFGIKFVKTLI